MEREEVKKILRIITVTYPTYKIDNISEVVDAWNVFLKDYTYQEISLALEAYVKGSASGFAPSVSQLIEYSQKITDYTEVSDSQAWDIVSKALRRSSYYAKEEFDKMPETIQKAVGSPSILHDWAIDPEYNNSVIQSNFLRNYREVKNRKKEFARLPIQMQQQIQKTIASMDNKLLIGG